MSTLEKRSCWTGTVAEVDQDEVFPSSSCGPEGQDPRIEVDRRERAQGGCSLCRSWGQGRVQRCLRRPARDDLGIARVFICQVSESDHGQDTRPRQAPQGDPQHPQDHADDGADRHGALQEGARPRHRGGGVHAQDRRAGRRPQRQRGQRHAPAAGEARDRSRTACCWSSAPTAACAAATTRPSCARPSARIRQIQADGHQPCTWNCPASGPSPTSATSGIAAEQTYTHFEDKPSFDEVEELANRYIADYIAGKIDRVEVAYMKFLNAARQAPVVETLLPLSAGTESGTRSTGPRRRYRPNRSSTSSCRAPRDILEELLPVSFKVRLFKCFLDAAVSEQIARRVAMKAATENAGDMIKTLTRQYNRARQAQITKEIAEVIGGAEAPEIANCNTPKGANLWLPQRQTVNRPANRAGDRLDVRRRVRRGPSARIYNAVKVDSEYKGVHDPPDRRGAAAPRRQPRPLRRARLDRRPGPRHEGGRYRQTGAGARR